MVPSLRDPTRYALPVRIWVNASLPSLIVPIVLLLSWELAVEAGAVPRTLIASPLQVARKFAIMLADGRLLRHASVSLARLLIGFIGGSALGIAFGASVGFSKRAARLLEPAILSLIPIPPIAWIPLLIILFGIGEPSKVGLIAIGSFCTLFIHTAYGIRTADRSYVELASVFEKSDVSLLRSVLLPSALPSIISSMRVAMALSWTLLMASEIIASAAGLGWLIWDARNFSRPDDMIVGMVAVGILGKGTDSGLVALERLLTRYRRTYSSE